MTPQENLGAILIFINRDQDYPPSLTFLLAYSEGDTP